MGIDCLVSSSEEVEARRRFPHNIEGNTENFSSGEIGRDPWLQSSFVASQSQIRRRRTKDMLLNRHVYDTRSRLNVHDA